MGAPVSVVLSEWLH